MLTAFLTTLEQMVRLLLLLVIGFSLNKLHLVPKSTAQVISKLVALLFLPCLTMYTYMVNCDFSSLITYSQWTLVGALCTAVSIGIAVLLSGWFSGGDSYLKGVYRYALAIPNTGGIATPLILAFFGTAGLFKNQMLLFILGLVCYSWGIMQLLPSGGQHGLKQVLRRIFSANFIAMLIGIALGLVGVKHWMPPIVLGTVKELGNCYVIMALLATGYSIADFPLRDVVGSRKIYLYAALRLLIIPCLFLGLMVLIKAPALLALFVVLSFGCPCGMNAVIYPSAYGQDCKAGSSMVLITSLLAIVTIPLLYALVIAVFGPVA